MCISTPCEDIPANSVVFVLGFLHLGEKDGIIVPGQANVQLAQALERCAERFSLVLTQKAISDALANPRALQDGTPVLQMHRHDSNIPVRTLAALRCALGRFAEIPECIVLLAHPRHCQRALMDLKALYGGKIIVLHPDEAVYPSKHWTYPLRWACKNLPAWPVDYLLLQSIKHPALAPLWIVLKQLGIRMDCPEELRLSTILRTNGKWKEEEEK
jgi:hypothetical protein